MIYQARHLIVFAIVAATLVACKPRQERMGEYKLMRYKQVEQVEKQLKSVTRLVKLEGKSSTNALIRAKYRKDLGKAYGIATDLFGDSSHVAGKIARITKGDVVEYDTKKNSLNETVQLGFAIENESYKRAYLNGLVGEEISVRGRVLDVSSRKSTGKIKLRVPFTERVTQTDRLVLSYITARTHNKGDLKSVRRYQDVTLKFRVNEVSLREADNFVVIKLEGRVSKVTRLGWLGITSWKDEPAYLPVPFKKVASSKKKKGKKSSGGSKSSSSSSTASSSKSTSTASKTSTKTSSSTTTKTSLEDDWDDDSDDF